MSSSEARRGSRAGYAYAVLGAVVAVGLPACSGEGNPGTGGGPHYEGECDPTRCIEGQVCFYEEQCQGGACERVPVRCVASCAADQDCGPGHGCIDYEGGKVCAPSCDWHLCPDGQDCLGDGCSDQITCGHKKPCPNGDFCDYVDNDCYPLSGACKDRPCPQLNGALTTDQIACDDGVCRFRALSFPPIAGLETEGVVKVTSPAVAFNFPDADNVRFTWSTPGLPAVLVLVLRERPTWSGDVLPLAVWGASRAAGEQPTVVWSEGVAIQNGTWLPLPIAPIREKTLYLLVQAVKGGQLIAISPVVPFRIEGDDWPEPGDPCADPGVVGGSCDSPKRPQICYESAGQKRCRVLCASPADCLAINKNLKCVTDVELSTRVCL